MFKRIQIYNWTRDQVSAYRTTGPLVFRHESLLFISIDTIDRGMMRGYLSIGCQTNVKYIFLLEWPYLTHLLHMPHKHILVQRHSRNSSLIFEILPVSA